MRLIEAGPVHFGICKSDLTRPEGMAPLSEELVANMYSTAWVLPVAVLPVKISYPETAGDEALIIHPTIERNLDTDLGTRGLQAMLQVRKYFPPTLSAGMADPLESNGGIAEVDLYMHGVVPPIGFRGLLLNLTTPEGDLFFQEQPVDYDVGQYRRACMPPGTHPAINATPDAPPAPGSA